MKLRQKVITILIMSLGLIGCEKEENALTSGILSIYGITTESTGDPGHSIVIEKDAFRFDTDQDVIEILKLLCEKIEESMNDEYSGISLSVHSTSDDKVAIIDADITNYEASYTSSSNTKNIILKTLEQLEGKEDGMIDEIRVNFKSAFNEIGLEE